MAPLLRSPRHRRRRRAAGKAARPGVLATLITSYHAITAQGRAINRYRHNTANGRTARGLSRRFELNEDMILCFATRPGLDIFTNNEAERTISPVKVQQRTSGGCWRTLQGLADFATVQSYLSTAAKWHISKSTPFAPLQRQTLATSPPSNPASNQPALRTTTNR